MAFLLRRATGESIGELKAKNKQSFSAGFSPDHCTKLGSARIVFGGNVSVEEKFGA
jgi:hypothetical protein